MTSSNSLPIRHLRQFLFCPRIPWLQEVAAMQPLRPIWVTQGQGYHARQEFLSRRRKLSRYSTEDAELLFDQPVGCENPSIHGRIDLVLKGKDRVQIVEFKLGEGKPVPGQILQAAAYAIAAEQTFALPCPEFFVATGKKAKVHHYYLTAERRQEVADKVTQIQQTLADSVLPESSAQSNTQCSSCEYLNTCNDRD
ncbi:CRISPR-associated protein Cas4 [Parendozoicomonas haliclonae]|uniref:CRISPR-associated exonuclease Cas4 n=1 Tax=Parendozoicomonas haliclonae TaxID=1960125 RepID=A0A1X7AHJ3_9GAMM|nr:CRISPR-associated protein Cas4 [Parendozoicomonas haliclonae]SMA42928.1 PD-(D/E)XK nuclease superfamily protein [Parendozoicomonas haliclonae]